MKKLQEAIAMLTGYDVNKISGQERIQDFGIDSILLVELIIEIEDRFMITFSDSDLNPSDIETIDDLKRLIEKTKKEKEKG